MNARVGHLPVSDHSGQLDRRVGCLTCVISEVVRAAQGVLGLEELRSGLLAARGGTSLFVRAMAVILAEAVADGYRGHRSRRLGGHPRSGCAAGGGEHLMNNASYRVAATHGNTALALELNIQGARRSSERAF